MLDPTMPRPAPAPGELGVIFAQPDARHALLVVEGEIDTLTAGTLERALSKLLSDPSDVHVVDLAAVTFLASSGLAVLIRAKKLPEPLVIVATGLVGLALKQGFGR